MKQVKLTQDRYAIVDDEDFENISQHNWAVNSMGYAHRTITLTPSSIDGKRNRKTIKMHHEILRPVDSLVVDHINRNKLDNRRSNLRLVTYSENLLNAGHRLKRGAAYFDKFKNKWRAIIPVDRRRIHLGYFSNKEDAVSCRLAAESQINFNN